MSKKTLLLALTLIVALVFYYSWLPDTNMKSETYLPQWLLDWSNFHYNLRTAVPFVPFGYLLQAYSKRKNLNTVNENKNLIFIQNLGVAGIVTLIAECGQFLIKGRSPDLMDVYFGIIGSLVGALAYNLFNKIRLRNAK